MCKTWCSADLAFLKFCLFYSYHDIFSGGDVFGTVPENTLIRQKIMLIPNAKGVVTYIAPKGMYTVVDTVLEIEFEGKKSKHSMMQV